MWNALFGRVPSVTTSAEHFEEEKETLPLIGYLIDGVNRISITLPDESICTDFPSMRQWVFETIAPLTNEEDIEMYTFKVVPDNYIYWYKILIAEEEEEVEAYGILVKYDPQERCFTSIQDGELPIIPQPKRVRSKVGTSIGNIGNSTSSYPPKQNKNKRNRK